MFTFLSNRLTGSKTVHCMSLLITFVILAWLFFFQICLSLLFPQFCKCHHYPLSCPSQKVTAVLPFLFPPPVLLLSLGLCRALWLCCPCFCAVDCPLCWASHLQIIGYLSFLCLGSLTYLWGQTLKLLLLPFICWPCLLALFYFMPPFPFNRAYFCFEIKIFLVLKF